MQKKDSLTQHLAEKSYPYGFSSNISEEIAPKGLNEAIVSMLSAKKKEPQWMLERRLLAFKKWKKMKAPRWGNLAYAPIDFQSFSYYAAPKRKKIANLSEADPEILRLFERLGIPLAEQKRLAGVAVDAVLDSESVGTTFQKELEKVGVIFCSFGEALQKYPALIREYMGKVVPLGDNYYSLLNDAVFSDGSFCYIPKGVRCPLPLSTYFRINAANTGQFERTLIVAEAGAFVEYMEGCTAPMRENYQLHSAVVEIYAHKEATVKYSTIQNWYPGTPDGKGGIYNFVVKRALCAGERAKVSWVQLETGSAITWKYPSCILKGRESVGEFYSVAISKNHQQADTGSKMHHLGEKTRSRIVAKGISAGKGQNTYRGMVQIGPRAHHAHHFSQCDSLLIGKECGAHTLPTLDGMSDSATIHHEATTSKIDQTQLFYARTRGLSEESANALIATGFCQEVLGRLPMEFAMEAKKLLEITLEGSVG